MPYGMYISASGAEAQTRTLEVLSNNLANVDTVGFKQDYAIVNARHTEAIEQGIDRAGSRSINDIGGGTANEEVVTDFSRGVVKQTGIATDFVIDDPEARGFFVVERDGQQLLTRAGNFRFEANGKLVTQDGYPVLSQEGGSVVIEPRLPWRLNDDGSIEQAGSLIPLALQEPASFGDLVKVGNNVFSSLAETKPLPEEKRQVRSGYLEMSSVRPTQLMMDLIKASRLYEANVRLIQHQDHMMGNLVNRVLRQ